MIKMSAFFLILILGMEVLSKDSIHFLNTGNSDCILFMSEKGYGIIDASTNYKNEKEPLKEVVPLQLNPKKNQEDMGSSSPNQSVASVLKYLEALKVPHLDFVILTNTHADHIGGIPALAYKYIDSNTKVYYRKYRKSIEDITMPETPNFAYYKAAILSLREKKAEMIDVTDKQISFKFGEMDIQLLNTELDKEDSRKEENHHSIVTFVKFGEKKILLGGDMTMEEEDKIFKATGKVDVYKISCHGLSENSFDFLKKIDATVSILTSAEPERKPELNSIPIIAFVNQILKKKVYVTGKAPKATEKAEEAALVLNLVLKGNKKKLKFNKGEYEKNITGISGWFNIRRNQKAYGKFKTDFKKEKVFIKEGLLLTGLQKIKIKTVKEEGKPKFNEYYFYFNEDGIMQKGLIKMKDGSLMYFNPKTGRGKKGDQILELDGKPCKMYFGKEGTALVSVSKKIKRRLVTFDANGCVLPNKQEEL